jgi:hypothetical protein
MEKIYKLTFELIIALIYNIYKSLLNSLFQQSTEGAKNKSMRSLLSQTASSEIIYIDFWWESSLLFSPHDSPGRKINLEKGEIS